MRNTASRTLEIIAATALTAVAFTVLILLFPSMKSSDVAAWVQAVGSIVAIIAAFLIPMYQHKKLDKAADEERALNVLTLLKSLSHLVLASEVHVKLAKDAFFSGSRGAFDHYFATHYRPGDLRDIAEAIVQFQTGEISAGMYSLILLRGTLITLDKYLAHFKEEDFTDPQYREMVERLRKDYDLVCTVRQNLQDEMVRVANRVGDRTRVTTIMETRF